MHLTALVVLWFVSAGTAQDSDEDQKEPSGYHQLVGIPRAEAIKAYEESIQSQENSRIYNGIDVKENELAYYSFVAGLQVHLSESGQISYCAAALISQNMLVTIAHCWNDGNLTATHITVVLGSLYLYTGGLRIDTNNVYAHPQFRPPSHDHDIAVIHLPQDVEFTNVIAEQMTSQVLRYVDLQVMSDEACRESSGNSLPLGGLCTSGREGKSPCFGDSGAPLFTYTNRKILIAMSSSNVGYFCGLGKPSLYTRISSYVEFIQGQGRLPRFKHTIEARPNGFYHENITVWYKVGTKIKKVSHAMVMHSFV